MHIKIYQLDGYIDSYIYKDRQIVYSQSRYLKREVCKLITAKI